VADRSPDWMSPARGELSAAQHLRAGGHWAWCCFTCHQAAEKALRAALEHFHDGRMGHNLNELRCVLQGHTSVPVAVQEACTRLNRLYIPTRYPDAFPSGAPVAQYVAGDAQEALADAQEVLHFVESTLGPP
jgi:HEPN domain-containing protein